MPIAKRVRNADLVAARMPALNPLAASNLAPALAAVADAGGAGLAGGDAIDIAAGEIDFGAVLAAQLGVKPAPALPAAAVDLPVKADKPAGDAAQEPAAVEALQAALSGLPTAAPPMPAWTAPVTAAAERGPPAPGREGASGIQRARAQSLDRLEEPPPPATAAPSVRAEAAILAAAKPEETIQARPEKAERGEAGGVPGPRNDVNALPHEPTHAVRHAERSVMETPVRAGARSFPDEVGQRVVWMAANGQHAAELRVDPPQLGPVEVRLTLNGDQASLTLLSPHQSVRDALQSSLPRLQEMLVGAGVDLGSVNVGSHAPGQDRGGESRGNGNAPPAWMNAPAGAVSGVAVVRASSRGLVDTYA
jgi:flagellar hook-length control protein FliK